MYNGALYYFRISIFVSGIVWNSVFGKKKEQLQRASSMILDSGSGSDKFFLSYFRLGPRFISDDQVVLKKWKLVI